VGASPAQAARHRFRFGYERCAIENSPRPHHTAPPSPHIRRVAVGPSRSTSHRGHDRPWRKQKTPSCAERAVFSRAVIAVRAVSPARTKHRPRSHRSNSTHAVQSYVEPRPECAPISLRSLAAQGNDTSGAKLTQHPLPCPRPHSAHLIHSLHGTQHGHRRDGLVCDCTAPFNAPPATTKGCVLKGGATSDLVRTPCLLCRQDALLESPGPAVPRRRYAAMAQHRRGALRPLESTALMPTPAKHKTDDAPYRLNPFAAKPRTGRGRIGRPWCRLRPGLSLGDLPRGQTAWRLFCAALAHLPGGKDSRSAGATQRADYFSSTLPLSFALRPPPRRLLTTGLRAVPCGQHPARPTPGRKGLSFFRT